MTQDNTQQIDLVALQHRMEGIQNQRNAAFDDAANMYGQLQSANRMIQQLVQQIQGMNTAQAAPAPAEAKPVAKKKTKAEKIGKTEAVEEVA